MRVLFDGNVFTTQPSGGVSRYFIHLAKGINACPGSAALILAPAHINTYLKNTPRSIGGGLYFPARKGVNRACRLTTKYISPFLSGHIQHDIVHETYYTQMPYFRSNAPRVTTMHDMIHEIFGYDVCTTNAKKASLARCAHVICVSEQTREDLCERFGIEPERTSTVYHGYHDFSGYDTNHLAHLFEGKPFFLYVGARSGYKNFERFLYAFAAQPVLRKEMRILCFGGRVFSKQEEETIRSLGFSERQIFQLNGADDVLAAAYREATALIYPSLYEGFGFPPLEAMSVGCPVVCSNTSSLPEVVGSAALTFDPKDVDAIGDSLLRVAHSKQLRQELACLGHQQRVKFSWERCCQQTLQVYRALI